MQDRHVCPYRRNALGPCDFDSQSKTVPRFTSVQMRQQATAWSVCLLLATLLLRQTAAQDGCAYEMLTCKNGGAFDPTQCQPFVNCEVGDASTNYKGWNAYRVCQCQAPFTGADCSIVTRSSPDQKVCKDNQMWDSSPVNLNTSLKYFECYMVPSEVMTLRGHRVYVNVTNANIPGAMQIDLALISRHHNPNSESLECVRADADITCNLRKCRANTLTTGDATYTCDELTCTSCGELSGTPTGCSAMVSTVAKLVTAPLSIMLTSVDLDA